MASWFFCVVRIIIESIKLTWFDFRHLFNSFPFNLIGCFFSRLHCLIKNKLITTKKDFCFFFIYFISCCLLFLTLFFNRTILWFMKFESTSLTLLLHMIEISLHKKNEKMFSKSKQQKEKNWIEWKRQEYFSHDVDSDCIKDFNTFRSLAICQFFFYSSFVSFIEIDFYFFFFSLVSFHSHLIAWCVLSFVFFLSFKMQK